MRRGDGTSRAQSCQSAEIRLEKLLLSLSWYAEWKGGELTYRYEEKIKDKV